MKKYIKDFYYGIVSLLVTVLVTSPGAIFLAFMAGIFVKAVIWAFKVGFNFL